MMAQQSEPKPPNSLHITARLFDFVDLHPSRIHHLSFSGTSSKLYVSRLLYSQVYEVTPSADPKHVSIEQLMVFQPCQQMYEIDGLIVMLLSFEMKVSLSGKWVVYPFTSQLLPHNTKWSEKQNRLYTFHANECREWSISQDNGVDVRHLGKLETPYHITAEGVLEGYGKKIKPNNFKDNKFTIVQLTQCGHYLFVGSNHGHLHIYQTKFMTHVKTFQRHQAAILSIVESDGVCYFTGSDSKISSVVNIGAKEGNEGQWVLSKQVRRQSHDIFATTAATLGQDSRYLLSGGITTDVCFERLTEAGLLSDSFSHKIGFSSEKLTHFIDTYLVVNKYCGFEIWQISDGPTKQAVELVVKYDMPFHKSIRQILVKEEKGKIVVLVTTQEEAALWAFDEETGLTKLLTVKNTYNVVAWHKIKNVVTIRDGNKLEMFNYKTGHIKEVAQTHVQFPTDLKINQQLTNTMVVGSRFSKQIAVYRMSLQKMGTNVGSFLLSHTYNILDFCYHNPQNLMIKLSQEQTIKEYNRKGEFLEEIVKIPVTKVRDTGWFPFHTRKKRKSYWYAISEGKIVIVSRMSTNSKTKKVRVKQMPRIGSVVAKPMEEDKTQDPQLGDWNLGVIPLNFQKMIAEEVQPIISKKIM